MTDFFTRLATRAIGTTPAIQPVVVSRYAPAGLPDQVATGLDAEPESGQLRMDPGVLRKDFRRLVSASEIDSRSGSPLVQDELEGTMPPGEISDELTASRAIPGGDSHSTSEQGAIASESATVPETGESTSLTGVSSPVEITVGPRSSEAQLLDVQPSAEGEALQTVVRAMRSSGQDLRAPLAEVQDGSDRSWNAESETVELMSPVKRQGRIDQDEPFPVSLGPLRNEPPFPSPDERTDSTRPVVRVSIGRIDVRAVTPAAVPAPRAQGPAPPKLSLDDFLRQHNGRRH
ncbi:MAG: hypothetical protein QOK48_458 [Blastocatellia bacterium]|jgi:hypothetical protein|nr:hypothetical protein [Blastocatellia bacterium]